MFYADQHMHSSVSFDSHSSRSDMAAAAAQAGLSALCFTDHYDVVDEHGTFVPHYDWAPAREAHAQAQKDWGDQLFLGFGIEVGNAPEDFSMAERIISEPGLDLVIGSIHNGSAALKHQDYYYADFNSPAMCHQFLEDYFQSMLLLAQWGKFDTLGHIPYPLRYMRDRDGHDISLAPYEPIIREILNAVIHAGKAIELNTCKYHPGSAADYVGILRTYRELGGELVTVGADAHAPENVAKAFPEGHELLKQCGFRYVTHFIGRTPHPISLYHEEDLHHA